MAHVYHNAQGDNEIDTEDGDTLLPDSTSAKVKGELSTHCYAVW